MDSFEKAFKGLNDIQRAAVTTLEGPILVIAGPGTGKTQLVTTRIGHILKTTDTLPSNILCLTFTEAGVEAMRERLNLFLGQAAYEINISTYHAFGSEIIRRYPEYFEAGLEPIDELESFTILRSIITRLPYSNPLKFADAQLPDILRFISDSKRALLLPKDVRVIAKNNQSHIELLNKAAEPVLSKLGVISKKSLPLFEQLLPILDSSPTQKVKMPGSVRPLAYYAANSLKEALAEVDVNGKTTPITVWKNAWLAKDQDGNFIFAGQKQNEKLEAAAGVYEHYQSNLTKRRLYDYDDMILRAIDVLQSRPELKYTIAEQYLYIMLDEFQDTNPAQMRLIELLTDHPVLEGRPNVLAVGDDDQAIYAFQGADHANMAEFARHYSGVKIITLEENYRSYPEVLETASRVAGQISDRLHLFP
ncbi:ATP-dependent helicase, partial [Candidatus Saccharibacteria bacterium]|nr:ATP-dependent helicase [Candidatus Saccharibacteria bacterium]